MVELLDRKKSANWPGLIGRCVVSFILVLLTQFSQFLVPQFFFDLPVFIQLLLSALLLLAVVGAVGWCRRLLRVRASAPAFVFFSVLFVWVVYIAIVRRVATHLMDLLFNGQIILLIFGLCRMLSSDPGLVSYSPSPLDVIAQSSSLEIDTYHQETEFLTSSPYLRRSTEADTELGDRVRCCQICKAYVKGFDHHCPAFGNCIGHKNYLLFMVLLIGFLWTEATYLVCLSQYAAQSVVPDGDGTRLEISLSRKVASSTMLFSILQLVWQVVFLLWHMYCICFNIRTDEWIHWKRYPEFQIFIQSSHGERSSEVRFKNPYDKGVLQNLKEFMASKR
ncbi:probable palmitoyltransferase ZDHHC12 isoform X1 [Cucurbita moschata]|uniref:S-acyltransferase n=1 Tax=Cucurbita moschata TaxID=3662 RepID=A0A6J1G6I4_CUCMO|nr:probable palmitoyltransferase ZDHHC12 isoform X1 [Cucurbita moschata]